MDSNNITISNPLSKKEVREFLAARSESLSAVIAYLESGEYWVLDGKGSLVDISLQQLNSSILSPAPPPLYDPVETGYVLNYLCAGRTVRLLEWLEANPSNRVSELLTNPEIDDAFRMRIRTLFKILTKAILLHTLFGPARQAEILECLKES